jgi:peptidoglycan-associated lipoprotein
MTRMKLLLSVASLALLLGACTDPPKKETTVEEPKVEASNKTTETSTGLTDEQIAAQELEAKRKRLEDMINKIMSEDVYFEYDKAILTEKARELLGQVGDILIKETEFEVRVEGHTDARGTEAYNMSLGGKRAQTVQNYLLNYGVDKARIRTVSFGEEKPKLEGESEEAFSQNRRANFSVRIIK